MPLQICILETDVLRPELTAQFHSYGRMFVQLFNQQPVAAEFEIYNVVKGCYPPDSKHFDAYLVTGSKADAFGTDAWIQTLKIYLRERLDRGDKVLGVCFGHQLLALILGGKVERAKQGWGVGLHQYQVERKSSWMSPPADNLTLPVSHQDQVTQLPENATLLASSLFCPIASYCVGDQVLCFQAHPEFVQGYSKALLDLRHEQLGDLIYSAAVNSLQQKHQGQIVAEWMMRFVSSGEPIS
ncbi:amidotransferase [Pseudomonas aeruginosa]